MNKIELRDLIISAIVLAFVFAYEGFDKLNNIPNNFIIALVAVSLGFILHELSHRFVARKSRCYAEYKLWKEGLIIAIALALLTNGMFTFAAPGAVMIYPLVDLWGREVRVTKRDIGFISISGPLMNTFLAILFFALNILFPFNVFALAAKINLWLALFNMIPIPPLDGSKVFFWNKRIWLVLFAALISMFFIF
ncbi:MAG: site-2 protease family protein [Candidatus Aenigmatarchaeota archaeon]